MTQYIVCLVNNGEVHKTTVDADMARTHQGTLSFSDDGKTVAEFTLWAWYAEESALPDRA